MKTIKIIVTVFALSVMYQYAEAQNNCPGNKIKMSKGFKKCGCNTCTKTCVAPADTAAYIANGWHYGESCSTCCWGNWIRLDGDAPSTETTLADIYPNPASGIVTIDFILSQQGEVTLEVFDVTGRYVSAIAHDVFEEDGNEVTWDASRVNPGVYFLRMKAGSYSAMKRISVIK